jgi:hypothetical protein
MWNRSMRKRLRENFKLGYYLSYGVATFLIVAFGLSIVNNWVAGVDLSHIVVEVDGKYYERGRGGGPGGLEDDWNREMAPEVAQKYLTRRGLENNWHREMVPEVAQKYLARKEMLSRIQRTVFVVVAIGAPFFICATASRWKRIVEDRGECGQHEEGPPPGVGCE